ncbi:DUF521 domain-containing protein [Peptoniphilus sp. AGMB00490]|uniref:DUF521 domain-containing protein n=1 Tax=Peptoniphilus faecalis TaxID=2731255 RepID=A0A848RJT1_9FIRM|nr:aconitase X catalytic domain-containing protein [Peptoniphilus faecalis]NMW85743.1 DUF521 domain-containing protein [Peptoniphilus faecalis]
MKLTDYEKEMLDGKHGEMKKKSMLALVDLAKFYNVEEFVEIVGCHDDSTVYAGEAQVQFAEYLADNGAKFSVPTTTNAMANDINRWAEQKHDIGTMYATNRIQASHIKMGAVPTWSCAPYQIGVAPSFGQQFASAESNVICYYNSVIGARTNRYAGPLELLCAIAGRVPYYGLHKKENRFAEGLITIGNDIKEEYFEDREIFTLIGYLFGEIAADRIFAIDGIPGKYVSNDVLKQFSATASSSGGVALFHMIGITPEAKTKSEAFGGRVPKEVFEIHIEDLNRAEKMLSSESKDNLDAVLLGCPHLSYNECVQINKLLAGRRIVEKTQFWITISKVTEDLIKESGIYESLLRSGIEIYTDGCILEYRNDKWNSKVIMSDSGKFNSYAFSMRGVQPIIGNLRECVESGIYGKVVKGEKPWKIH